MIIAMCRIIIFHLIERLPIVKKSLKEAEEYGQNMLGFSYLALQTRHEKPM